MLIELTYETARLRPSRSAQITCSSIVKLREPDNLFIFLFILSSNIDIYLDMYLFKLTLFIHLDSYLSLRLDVDSSN